MRRISRKSKRPDVEVLKSLYDAALERMKDQREASGHINSRYGTVLTTVGVLFGLGLIQNFPTVATNHLVASFLQIVGLLFLFLAAWRSITGLGMTGPRLLDPFSFMDVEEVSVGVGTDDAVVFYQDAVISLSSQIAENDAYLDDKMDIAQKSIGDLTIGMALIAASQAIIIMSALGANHEISNIWLKATAWHHHQTRGGQDDATGSAETAKGTPKPSCPPHRR